MTGSSNANENITEKQFMNLNSETLINDSGRLNIESVFTSSHHTNTNLIQNNSLTSQ
jgi:hypothetical protein